MWWPFHPSFLWNSDSKLKSNLWQNFTCIAFTLKHKFSHRSSHLPLCLKINHYFSSCWVSLLIMFYRFFIVIFYSIFFFLLFVLIFFSWYLGVIFLSVYRSFLLIDNLWSFDDKLVMSFEWCLSSFNSIIFFHG